MKSLQTCCGCVEGIREIIIANRSRHIHNWPGCPNYSQVAPQNRVVFNSAAEAENAGYRVAGNCP